MTPVVFHLHREPPSQATAPLPTIGRGLIHWARTHGLAVAILGCATVWMIAGVAAYFIF